MENRYVEILKKSSFDELTSDEKEIIGELCSNQEEFDDAKHLMKSMESLEKESFRMESSRVKDRLDSEFKEVYGTEGGFRFLHFLCPPVTPFYTKPGLQLAFLLIFVFTVYYSIDFYLLPKEITEPHKRAMKPCAISISKIYFIFKNQTIP